MRQGFRIPSLVLVLSALVCSRTDAQGVRGFGTPQGKLPVRGFGIPSGKDALMRQFPELAVIANQTDWKNAARLVAITDRNNDQVLTKEEYRAAGHDMKWFAINDLNGDKLLPLDEIVLRYAQLRRSKERAAQRAKSAERASRSRRAPLESNAAMQSPARLDSQVQARSRQTRDLAAYVMRVYDLNGSAIIERSEFQSRISLLGNLAGADSDGNGDVSRGELSRWLLNRLPPLPASQLAIEFQEHDSDKDGQVSLREFAPQMTPSEVAEFNRWDCNRDGFVTSRESASTPESEESSYSNERVVIIRPNGSVVSEIWIENEMVIGDLNVRVSVIKENDNFVDLYLIGPDSRRVKLFATGSRPWRGSYNLENTLLDDEAPVIKKTLPRPPIVPTLRPPGVGVKDQLSLAAFTGSSTRGVWKLVLINQDDHSGVLKSWSLSVTPREKSIPSKRGMRK